MEKPKKKFKMPDAVIIIAAIILLVYLLGYFIPTGEFDRYTDPDSGRTLVVPGSYHAVDVAPFNPLKIPGVIFRGSMTVADIIVFLIIVGGAFQLIMDTKVFDDLCCVIARKMVGRELLIIPVLTLFFAFLGLTEGFSVEALMFIPLGVTVAKVMKFDRVTGAAVILMGGLAGWTAGVVNPFNVGIAQSIAELELFSGMGLRWALLVVLWSTASWFIIRYELKCRKDAANSVMHGVVIDETDEESVDYDKVVLSARQKWALIVLGVGFTALIVGLVKFGWYFEEMAAILLVMGVICAKVNGATLDDIADGFSKGAASMGSCAALTGFCGSVALAMQECMILDTIIHYVSLAIESLPKALQAVGLYLGQALINVFIVSGTGQAAATMPIITPLADLLGISRQTAVLAFQLGDGFGNCILPSAVGFVGSCAIAKIPYTKWVKFVFPLFVIWSVIGAAFMLIAVAIGY